MTQLYLRYAPGKKTFTVQNANKLILARIPAIPASNLPDYITVLGEHYALTPQMYAQALAFRTVHLDLPLASLQVTKEKLKGKVTKTIEFIKNAANTFLGWFKGVPA